MAGAVRRLRPGDRRRGLSRHGRAGAFVEALGFDWVSVSEHHYSPRILTPSPRGLRRLPRRAHRADQDRPARADRAAQQPDPRRRGTGDARHAGAGPHRRRAAARHDQRVSELRPQPAGVARAHRRGDGADPEGVDRAAAVRLAGPLFPVPHRVDLAAPASSRIRRPTRSAPAPRPASSPRAIISVSACRTARSR